MSDLQNPAFHDEDAAREAWEAVRWPNGPFCPHCGNADPDAIAQGKGKVARPGLYYCSACNGQFTVTVGTVLERSKIPLSKWLLAMHLMGSSKKGMSAHQLHRMLAVTYKTAWFMAHRIREAMKDDGASGPLGGSGKVVEADELYIGKRERPIISKQRGNRPFTKKGKGGSREKRVVIGLVERGGHTRMFHVERATVEQVRDVVVRNVSRESALHTDESNLYTAMGAEFDAHRTVKHSAHEYVRYEGDTMVTSNTIENVFSVLRRGMHGVYQHCGDAHLHRYLNEFSFRHNHRSGLGFSDKERVSALMAGIEGKRLTYRRIGEAANA